MDAEGTNSETGAQGAPATDELTPSRLSGDDSRLVELVTAVLVDSNVHTDLRMRLSREITDMLSRTHEELYGPVDGPARREALQRSLAAADDHVSALLTAVLVDPNLHTDLRMRLCREIPELIRTGRESAGAASRAQNG
jgi:hypothetical protein